MTTREQIVAAALKVGLGEEFWLSNQHPNFEAEIGMLEKFYAIAFEAGRVAERKPKTRKVKMECFLIDGELHWRDENLSVLSHWIRQPHRDIVVEVPE